jgi:hypothetical protein
MTPLVSGVVSSATKSTRIIPSASGVGLPKSRVCTGADPPLTKICIEYRSTTAMPLTVAELSADGVNSTRRASTMLCASRRAAQLSASSSINRQRRRKIERDIGRRSSTAECKPRKWNSATN